MSEEEPTYSAYVAVDKEQPLIALANAILINERLMEEAFKSGQYTLGYALERQLDHLVRANNGLNTNTTTVP